MSAIERVGKVVRSKTAAVGVSLLVGTAIEVNLPREQQSAPETTPTPITRVSEPPRPTLTPYRTIAPTPIPTPTETPIKTHMPEAIYEDQQLKSLIPALDGFFSNTFIGREGLRSTTKAGPPYPNRVPFVETYYTFPTFVNDLNQESSWWIRVEDPNKIVQFNSFSIHSKHDKKTSDFKETESIVWANFDKVPELAAFTSKDKHGYFTLPQDKLRQFVEVSGIFDKAFIAKLKSFTWENYSKERAYDAGPETIQAVRATGKIGDSSVELTVDAQGVVVLRTTKG